MGLFDAAKAGAAAGMDFALSLLQGGASSDWQGLSPHLVAKFYPVISKVNGDGSRIYTQDFTQGVVMAPILDGAEMEYSLDWQSPFEQMGTEAKAPALTAMLQSGVLSQAYSGFMGKFDGEQAQEPKDGASVAQALETMVGRTGITKLNSTQTFSGMQPVKCTMKLLFRAYSNAQAEVNAPIQKLLEWAVPKELSQDSSLVIIAKNAAAGSTNAADYVSALLPSFSPTMIAMEYKGRKYCPMVIESIADPITSPTTSSGHYATAEVSMTIASLTAWDRNDIQNIYGGGLLGGILGGIL